jgi:hypothetical protein
MTQGLQEEMPSRLPLQQNLIPFLIPYLLTSSLRLANKTIQNKVMSVEGSLELLLSVGFVLQEKDEETILVFPDGQIEDWIRAAVKMIDACM